MRNNMSSSGGALARGTARSVDMDAGADGKVRQIFKALLLVAALVSAFTALRVHAETTAESLSRIEAETLVLKARDRQLQVQSDILTKQNDIAAKQSSGNVVSETQIVGDPVVRSVEGIGPAMFATLQMNDGSVVDVQNGTELPNGMRILSISPREVIARNTSGAHIRLATYSAVSARSNLDFGMKTSGPGGSK